MEQVVEINRVNESEERPKFSQMPVLGDYPLSMIERDEVGRGYVGLVLVQQ